MTIYLHHSTEATLLSVHDYIIKAMSHQQVNCLSLLDLLLNLSATQTNRLQHVLNSAARAVTNTSTFHHITPILKSLHLLKINEIIKYKVLSLSLTYISLKTGQPSYLCALPSHRCTRSSSHILVAILMSEKHWLTGFNLRHKWNTCLRTTGWLASISDTSGTHV